MSSYNVSIGYVSAFHSLTRTLGPGFCTYADTRMCLCLHVNIFAGLTNWSPNKQTCHCHRNKSRHHHHQHRAQQRVQPKWQDTTPIPKDVYSVLVSTFKEVKFHCQNPTALASDTPAWNDCIGLKNFSYASTTRQSTDPTCWFCLRRCMFEHAHTNAHSNIHVQTPDSWSFSDQ